MIDLGRGHPSTALLATKEVAQASSNVFNRLANTVEEFEDVDRHPLQYGTDLGPMSVRKTFAAWLSQMYEVPSIDPDLLCTTCGASFGLANTCLQLTDPLYTRRIFMITPAYFLAAKVFEDAGYGSKMYAIDEKNADGPDLLQIRTILEMDAENHTNYPTKSEMAGKRYKYLFYAVPSFSNPSGIVWSLENRQALLKLAREYDILIITDEVYDFLSYESEPSRPVSRLVDLDLETIAESSSTREWGNTISNMSFSKYLGPGLRIGTVQTATSNLVTQWSAGGANHSGGMMAQHTSYYIAELIENGSMNKVLARLNKVYQERSRTMLRALAKEMPEGTEVFGGTGGYFIWVKLPDSHTARMTASQILDVAMTEGYGVRALSGTAFEVPGHARGWGRQFIRLSLSYQEPIAAQAGIEILGRAVRDCQRQL